MTTQRIEARITLFDISTCGYYGYRKSDHRFCTLEETLKGIQGWSNGKPLLQTKTFEVQDGQDLHPVYLFDINSIKNNWLITTWNETSAYESGVASVQGSATVGKATVDLTDVGPGSIPGFPTYFYIIPSRNLLASVRFQHIWTCQQELREYIKSYLELFSPYVVLGKTEKNTHSIIGYKPPGDEELDSSIIPRFETREIRNPGKLDQIREKYDSINKITRKTTLDLNQQADLTLWQKMLAKASLTRHAGTGQKIKIKYDVNSKVTRKELDHMIESWENNRARTWDDYGVTYRGGPSTPDWFSHSIATTKIELKVKQISEAQVDPASLLKALEENRDEIEKLKK